MFLHLIAYVNILDIMVSVIEIILPSLKKVLFGTK